MPASRARGRQLIQRAVVDEPLDRHVAEQLLAAQDPQAAGVGDPADGRARQAPSWRTPPRPARRRTGSTTHSIRSWDSETMISNGSRPGSRRGTAATSMSIPTPPLEAISEAEEVRPAAPRSWRATSSPSLEQLQRALEQLLLLEGVAHLHGGAHVRSGPVLARELGGGEHRGAADPVATGGGAEQHDEVAGPAGGAADQLLAAGEPERHRVDQTVVLVGGLEVDLPADRGDADRVAVVTDPADGPVEQVATAVPDRRRGLSEAQRVEHRDRAGAEGEDVAQDPAHSGGRSLEGLDRAGVVVGLDLEGAHEPAGEVHGAGVLAGPEGHVLALGGERAEQQLGVLVGAVLAPHQRVHGQLDLVGRAALLLAHQLVLACGEPECERVLQRRDPGGRAHCGALRQPLPPWPDASTGRSSVRRSSRRSAR